MNLKIKEFSVNNRIITTLLLLFIISQQTIAMEKTPPTPSQQNITESLIAAFSAHVTAYKNPTEVVIFEQAKQAKNNVNDLLARNFYNKYIKNKR